MKEKMKYLIGVILFLVGIFSNYILRLLLKKANKNGNNKIIKPSSYLFALSILLIFLDLVLGIMIYFFNNIYFALLFCIPLIIFPLYMLIKYFTFKIELYEDSFEIRNFLFKKKKYDYKDVILVQLYTALIIQDNNGNELYRLSDIFGNTSLLYTHYISYFKENKCELTKSASSKIKCAPRVKITGFIFLFLGIILVFPSVVTILEKDYVSFSILFIFTVIIVITGFIFLWYYYFWNIQVNDDSFYINSLFFKKKIEFNSCYMVPITTTKIDFIDINTSKKIYSIFIHLLNNTNYIIDKFNDFINNKYYKKGN